MIFATDRQYSIKTLITNDYQREIISAMSQYVCSYPITPLIRALTYKAMVLHPNMKTKALYPNESFEKNFWKNRLVKAKLSSLRSGEIKLESYKMVNVWMLGSMLQRKTAYCMAFGSVVIFIITGV